MSHHDIKSAHACDDGALRSRLALALVIAAYFACALPKLTALPRVNVDEPWMMQLAHQLRTTGTTTLPMFDIHETFLLQPGYSFVVAPWTALVGEGIYQARLLSVVFGAVILWLTFRAGRELLDEAAGTAAAMFLAVDSNFLGAARMTRHDLMSLAFIVAALLWAVQAIRTGRSWQYAFAGVLSGIGFLFHANAFWTVIVVVIWLGLAEGTKVLFRPGVYAYATGVLVAVSPILLQWPAYSRQLYTFAGNIAPGISWSHLMASAEAEPTRYRNWYFGLSTEPGFNVWLLAFQLCAIAGVFVLAHDVWRARGERSWRSLGSTLVLSETTACVLVFAFMIPNKAHAYLPNLTVGFAWLAGAAVAAAIRRISQRESANIHGSTALLAIVLVYTGTATWHYYRWFGAAAAQGLAPYEETSATVSAMVPPGHKDVIAFPTFWLPFRNDSTTTFLSVTAVSPPGFTREHATFQYRVRMDDLAGDPIYVLVDDAHWQAMWQTGGPATAWRAFLDAHCSAESTAAGTAYGELVAYKCDPRGRPDVTTWIASTDGRWRAESTPVWTANAVDIARWDRYKPETVVTLRQEAVTIAAGHGGGVCANAPVSTGERYVLTYTAAASDATDLLSIAHASALGTHDDSATPGTAVWARVQSGRMPVQAPFVARATDVRVCFYSELPTAFTLKEVHLSRLDRYDPPADQRIP